MNKPDSEPAVNRKSGDHADHPPALIAGAASKDITPQRPLFLWGYPHGSRTSTGIHDPLLASALFLGDGDTGVLFVACDVLYIDRPLASRARQRIEEATGICASHIVVSATHTHSAPKTADTPFREVSADSPAADPDFIRKFEDGVVEAGVLAWRGREAAEAGFVEADGSAVGTNRHDPEGPRDARVPVLMVRSLEGHRPIGLMLTVCMHPTVLHEDSTLISADFPGMARIELGKFFPGCTVVYHTGPSGNQSPRHVTRANTFEEATRLGGLLAGSVRAALEGICFTPRVPLSCLRGEVDLPVRHLPQPGEAAMALDAARARLEELRQTGAPRPEVRSAECDCFGAERSLVLAHAAGGCGFQEALSSILPAEVQVIGIGPHTYGIWPGEMFVEFGLAVARHRPGTYVISMANGVLHGYLVTREAVERGSYEAGNALLESPAGGEALVRFTQSLLDRLFLDQPVESTRAGAGQE